MSALTMSILEDYDHDYIPIAEDDLESDSLNSDLNEIVELESQIAQTYTISRTFALRGVSRSSLMTLYGSQLLHGVSLSAVAMEAYAANDTDLDESVAMEALSDTLKQKVTEWSTKILSTLKYGAERIVSLMEPIYMRIKEGIASLTEAAWDTTKTATTIVKAHPYKTIAAVLAAAVAVGGVALYVSGNIPMAGCTNGTMKNFMDKLSGKWNSIRLPFGKIRTKTMIDGVTTYADVQTAEMVTVGTDRISALGWTAATVKATGILVESAFTSLFKALKTMGTTIVSPIRKILTSKALVPGEIANAVTHVTKTPMAGWATQKIVEMTYMKILFSLITNVFNMVNKISTVAMTMTRQSIAALRGSNLKKA